MIYLAAPVVPLSLLPAEVWREWLGADGEAVAAVRAVDTLSHLTKKRLPRRTGRRIQVPQQREAFMGEAFTLLASWFARWDRLQRAIVQNRRAVVAVFSEERTKKFFATLEPEVWAAGVEHLQRLETRGAILLAAQPTERQQRDLTFTVTLGGDAPGVALGDPTNPGELAVRQSLVSLAGSPEYTASRALFEDLINSPKRDASMRPSSRRSSGRGRTRAESETHLRRLCYGSLLAKQLLQ